MKTLFLFLFLFIASVVHAQGPFIPGLSPLSASPPLSGNVFASKTVSATGFVITFSATVAQTGAKYDYQIIHP